MVSVKSLTLLAASISAVTAMPQYPHARLHYRGTGASVGLPAPTGTSGPHHHQHNETETGPVLEGGAYGGNKAQETNVFGGAVNNKESTSCVSTHTEYVTSTNVATVTAARRWNPNHSNGGQGQYSWNPAPNTPAVPVVTESALGVSVGISMGGVSGAAPTATATGSAASAAPTIATGGASAGGKKGLSFNSPSLLNLFSSAGASWAYNWGAGAGGSVPSGVEFVPMLWGKDGIGAWSGAVQSAIASGTSHVLSFNEPDFPQQANIAASEAAQLHIANVAPLSGKVKIGSPAITNSNIAGQGLDWMKSFLGACGGAANNCKLDFLAFHWYNNPGTMDDFKSHVASVISLAQQNNIPKVWLTEFAVNGGSDDQAAFLQEALPYLDSQPAVERYAYFMVGNGQMLTNGALNVVGKAYSG